MVECLRMFEKERRMNFENGPQFPKTYVPNVIMLCVDERNATIKDIKEVERGI